MKESIKNVILSLASVVAISYSIEGFATLNNMHYYQAFKTDLVVVGILLVIFYMIIKKSSNIKISKSKTIAACLFSLFMVVGEVMSDAGTYFIIFKSFFTILLSLIKLVGFYTLFKICFIYLDSFLNSVKVKEIKVKNKKIKWFLNKFEDRPFITSLIVILIGWSIYLVAFYPIVLSPDPSWQIKQYFNVPNKYIDWVIQRDPNVFMTTHHPITQTFMLGWAIELGRFILDDNFGLFIYTIVQTLIYSSVLAYTIKFAKKHNVKTILCLILLGLYIFVPMFGFYTVSAVKDTLYTAFMILFVLFIYDVIDCYKDKEISWWYSLYFAIVMILISLFRHNGVYVILLSLPSVLIFAKQNRVKLLSSTILFLVFIYGFNNVLVPSLGISEGSIREMLSVPFQQTARYVKYNEDDLSDEDKEVIDKILGYSDLAERYSPDIADPVKNEFNKNTTTDDLKEYFKVWFKGLLKHPETYVDATLNNVYGYVYPHAHKWYFYYKYEKIVLEDNLVDYHYSNWSKDLRNILTHLAYLFPSIPLIGLISSIGFNFWIIVILTCYLITKDKKKYLIALVPLYGSFLICLISPVNTYFRYTMPYVFALPVMTMLLFNHVRGVKNEKK